MQQPSLYRRGVGSGCSRCAHVPSIHVALSSTALQQIESHLLALAQAKGAYSCGDRIGWLRSARGMSELDACRRIAVDEFAATCGLCRPASQTTPALPSVNPSAVIQRMAWTAPGGRGRSEGACRTATGGLGSMTAAWLLSEQECQQRCGEAPACVAYEYHDYGDGRGYRRSKCEIHTVSRM